MPRPIAEVSPEPRAASRCSAPASTSSTRRRTARSRMSSPPAGRLAADTGADPRRAGLLAALGHESCAADTLAARCGLSAAETAALLTQLELDSRIAALPGGLFQRLHR